MENKKNFKFQGEISALIWCIVAAVVCFAAHILVCAGTEIRPAVSGMIFLFAYLVAVASVSLIIFKYKKARGSAEEKLSTSSNAIRDLLQQAHMPIVLTDGRGKIIWYNNDLAQSFGIGTSAIGTSMHSFCPTTELQLLEATATYYHDDSVKTGTVDASAAVMMIRGRRYRANCYRVRASIKSQDDIRDFYMTMFHDITDLHDAHDFIKRSAPVVAYAIVDNLEELSQSTNVSYRQEANKIEHILKEWASSMNGTIREYDRDKYMIVFSREMLDECIAAKFSVLDKIRDIKIGEGDASTPVTVSMGIASVRPSLDSEITLDLNATAQEAASALELALQRGGDQAAVKTDTGIEFFGGRVKSAQKKTRVKVRVMAGKLCGLIAKSSTVLIMGHKNPDFDSIGACVGIARLCMFCGVEAKIIIDKVNPNFKICEEKLAANPDYEDIFIDRTSAIDLMSPSTLLVIVDANNFAIIEAPEIAANAKTIFIIDHHRQTTELPDSVVAAPYIDSLASSACELVAEMIDQCTPEKTLHPDEANVMLSGIMVDTKNFTRSTGTRTFAAALYLQNEGANPEIARTFFSEEFNDYVAEAKFGADVKIYREHLAITKSEGTGSGADRVAAAKSADKLLTIRGVDASFALVKIGDSVNISARSNGKINVQLILEQLHGGGHFDVAGAQLADSSLDASEALLKEAIDNYLDNP